MVAMGQIPDSLFGFEASGIITRVASDVKSLQPGQRVSCLGHGAHRTHFRSPAAFCQVIPDDITFEEAAGLPLVHATAYHALVNVVRVRKGQTILIHAAAGGVGQAAIQLAKHYEMEIFATVGSADKRALVQEEYGIPDDHIFYSRDTSFAKGIKRITGGRGVDCILNSLAGEQLRQTWHCIAPFGTFVEIGLKDILGNTRLDMRPFIQDATFSFLNLQHVQKARPELMAEILKETFGLLRQKVTRPVSPLTIFPISDVENAFRVMQAGKHRGKLVLSFSPEHVVKVHRNPSAELRLKSNGTYVLVGGFGGIGSSLAHLLVEHGARNIAFISRSEASSEEAKNLLAELKKDAVVKAYSCDISDEAALQGTVQQCASEMPPIKGVIQCAMVLRDALFENMNHRQWTESIRPKVQGTWNLHEHLPKELDFFIILSSFAGVFGNRGQANYAAAGAYEDAFAHYRRSLGLKAVSIDLGIMREVGVLATGTANASRDLKDWEVPFGIRQIELHALIRKIIASEASNDDDVGAQVLTGFATGGGVANAGIRRPFYFEDPRFSVLELTGQRSQDGNADTEATVSLKAQLSAAKTVEAACEAVTICLVDKIATMMQTSVEEIDSGRPLHSFGVDSLVAVEVRNWLTKEAKADVTVFDILAAVPITSLAQIVVSKSALVSKGEESKGTE
jgi:NADPH:quinone reductase-like Zn-dependent oxidoreductase